MTGVTRKISVLASNGLAFTLRVRFNYILLNYSALSVSYSKQV